MAVERALASTAADVVPAAQWRRLDGKADGRRRPALGETVVGWVVVGSAVGARWRRDGPAASGAAAVAQPAACGGGSGSVAGGGGGGG